MKCKVSWYFISLWESLCNKAALDLIPPAGQRNQELLCLVSFYIPEEFILIRAKWFRCKLNPELSSDCFRGQKKIKNWLKCKATPVSIDGPKDIQQIGRGYNQEQNEACMTYKTSSYVPSSSNIGCGHSRVRPWGKNWFKCEIIPVSPVSTSFHPKKSEESPRIT